jgi:hypothetical protein
MWYLVGTGSRSPDNAIYGDTPQRIGEYQDALGIASEAFLHWRYTIL